MYSLKVEQASCIIVGEFEEIFQTPFKAAVDVPTIRSFQRQLKDIFQKVVESDLIYKNLSEIVNRMIKNLSNYYYPNTQFATASNLHSKMDFGQKVKCFVERKQQFLDVCAQFRQIDLNLLSETEW